MEKRKYEDEDFNDEETEEYDEKVAKAKTEWLKKKTKNSCFVQFCNIQNSRDLQC